MCIALTPGTQKCTLMLYSLMGCPFSSRWVSSASRGSENSTRPQSWITPRTIAIWKKRKFILLFLHHKNKPFFFWTSGWDELPKLSRFDLTRIRRIFNHWFDSVKESKEYQRKGQRKKYAWAMNQSRLISWIFTVFGEILFNLLPVDLKIIKDW